MGYYPKSVRLFPPVADSAVRSFTSEVGGIYEYESIAERAGPSATQVQAKKGEAELDGGELIQHGIRRIGQILRHCQDSDRGRRRILA